MIDEKKNKSIKIKEIKPQKLKTYVTKKFQKNYNIQETSKEVYII